MTLHVVHAGAYLDRQRRRPVELLADWPTLVDVAQAVAAAGVRVSVVQAAAEDAHIVRGSVTYDFVRVAGTRRGARRVAAAVAALRPDVVHLHGLGFPFHAHALARALPDTPVLVQDHADIVPRGLRRRVAGRLLRHVDAAAFTAPMQAEPFLNAGVLSARTRIIVPESSTHFTPGDRAAARRALGLGDEPCVVWIGRLAAVKDPLLALDIFQRTLTAVPHARMLCAFGDAPLLPDVQQVLSADAHLASRVTLLGRRPHPEIELLLRAADVSLATSRSEGSGYALLEAFACGVTPVVSDIPSFRQLTGNGSRGLLFAPGDAEGGAAALVAALHAPLARSLVRQHFEEHLSFGVIGRTLVAAYNDLARTRRRIVMLVPGGVDRSGTTRVIPCVLALIERLARSVDLHVLALRQESHACSYTLLGARVECVPSGSRSAALRALRRLHRERRIDVLHALWMHPQGTTAALAGSLLQVPVLLHINGGDLTALPDAAFGGRATLPGRVRLRLAVAGAAHVTVPSQIVARDARALGITAERLTLGVARDRWPERAPRSRTSGGALRLLCVADLRPVKDHATLLHAVARLVECGRDVHLDCIGVDTMQGAAQRLTAQLGISDVVRFHDVLPHAALRALVVDAHALVVSSRYEGDPVAALEAAVAGVPVIGTAVGHLVEWAACDAALTCDTGDAAGLAGCIARIMDDEVLRVRIAQNAQVLAVACDADAAADRVLELYSSLTQPASELAIPQCVADGASLRTESLAEGPEVWEGRGVS
jgi:glycosyltransferase involved in cell wall biosynthesis